MTSNNWYLEFPQVIITGGLGNAIYKGPIMRVNEASVMA